MKKSWIRKRIEKGLGLAAGFLIAFTGIYLITGDAFAADTFIGSIGVAIALPLTLTIGVLFLELLGRQIPGGKEYLDRKQK